MWMHRSVLCLLLQLFLLLSLGTLMCCQEDNVGSSKKTDSEMTSSDENSTGETKTEENTTEATDETQTVGNTAEETRSDEEEPTSLPREDPHRDPSLCEVCKYLTTEVKVRLAETGKTKQLVETGYGLDRKKVKDYRKSELRLIEVINDPHVCDKILEYNVHAERKGSLRFAKGRSQTMETLHNLVHKGVNVELGIPYEMWDIPSSGVTEMQRQCFKIVEDYEEEIEDWYWNNQDQDFTKFLCQNRVLKADDQKCLSEIWSEEEYRKKQEEERIERDKFYAEKKKKEKARKKDMLKGEAENRDYDNDKRDEL